jgi:DNA-binding transcriptional LysR family regulator
MLPYDLLPFIQLATVTADTERVMRTDYKGVRDDLGSVAGMGRAAAADEIRGEAGTAGDPRVPAIVCSHRQTRVVTDSFVRPSFTLEQIRTFLAVASRQHVTNAARVLGLTQPAVSQQVQMLERALGVRLIERVGRGIRLTDAGLKVAGTCLLIMRSLESLEETAEALRGLERGTLTIGASQVTANYYLSRALTAFSAKHPVIEINIRVTDTRDICERVADGQLQCGLVDAPLPNCGLLQAKVATDKVVLVAHPENPLARSRDTGPVKLPNVLYLMWGPTSATEEIASKALGQLHQGLPKVRLPGLEAARQAVRADCRYVTMMPHVAVADALKSGELVRLDVPTPSRPICAIRRANPTDPAAEAFWQTLAEGCGQPPHREN